LSVRAEERHDGEKRQRQDEKEKGDCDGARRSGRGLRDGKGGSADAGGKNGHGLDRQLRLTSACLDRYRNRRQTGCMVTRAPAPKW